MLNRTRRFSGHTLGHSDGWRPRFVSLRLAQEVKDDPVIQKIQAANTTVEMTVNASRILSMDGRSPRPRSQTPICSTSRCSRKTRSRFMPRRPASRPSTCGMKNDEIHTVDVVISGDVRELDRLLRVQFPTASIKLFPTSSSTLILFGLRRPARLRQSHRADCRRVLSQSAQQHDRRRLAASAAARARSWKSRAPICKTWASTWRISRRAATSSARP